MKRVYDSDIYRKFPNFLSNLFYALNGFVCLLPRFLKKKTERTDVSVFSSIVQRELRDWKILIQHMGFCHLN